MPIRKPLVSIAGPDSVLFLEFDIKSERWSELECGYRTISSEARKELLWIVRYYLFDHAFEMDAAPIDEAIRAIVAIEKAATALQKTFSSGGSNLNSFDTNHAFNLYVFQQLEKFLPAPYNVASQMNLTILAFDISKACNLAIENIKTESPNATKKGYSATKYYARILAWAAQFDLPVTITNDSGATEAWKSDFQIFLERLNSLLPNSMRPKPSSGKSLTKTLLAVRKMTKKSEV